MVLILVKQRKQRWGVLFCDENRLCGRGGYSKETLVCDEDRLWRWRRVVKRDMNKASDEKGDQQGECSVPLSILSVPTAVLTQDYTGWQQYSKDNEVHPLCT